MAYDDMQGKGGSRPLVARWVVEAELVASSPLHLGSGEQGDIVDMPLLRDRATLQPLLTGSSLAGALRDYLCDRVLGDRQPESKGTPEITGLLGGTRGDPDGEQSPLIVLDSVGTPNGHEIRDGVAINPKHGVAEAHQKFDLELWPMGTRFMITLILEVLEGMSEGQEAALLAVLATALGGFQDGSIRLGARGRRGFGKCSLGRVRAFRFSLGDDPGSWLTWLATGLAHKEMPDSVPHAPDPVTATRAAWPAGAPAFDAALQDLAARDQRHSVRVSIPIRFRGGLLIGAPASGAKGADVWYLHSGGTAVASGTSIAGALRQRALRIARVVHGERASKHLVDALFGTRTIGRGRARGVRLAASRITAEEAVIPDGMDLQVTRVALDPFTQGTKETALLEEVPRYRGTANLELDLRLPAVSDGDSLADGMCGLLLLVVKDLLLGDIPLGGTTGVGRGSVEPDPGKAATITRDSRHRWSFDPDGAPPAEAEELERWVKAFHEPGLRPRFPRQNSAGGGAA